MLLTTKSIEIFAIHSNYTLVRRYTIYSQEPIAADEELRSYRNSKNNDVLSPRHQSSLLFFYSKCKLMR